MLLGELGCVHALLREEVGDRLQQAPLHDLEVRRMIDAHAGELSDPEALRESVDVVDQQIRSGSADSGFVRTLLHGMTARAGQITPVVETIARLEAALRSAI